MQTRTIVVEISGGVVVDVHGLPDNFVYWIADWDDVVAGGVKAEVLDKMIADALSIDNQSIGGSHK